MNAECAAFERWLDEGRPGERADGERAHAAGCTRCAALLELEEALAAPALAAAPRGFTDHVMERVHAVPSRAPRAVPSLFPTPVWVQALLDPLVALTLTALGLLVLGRDALGSLGGSLAAGWEGFEWPVLRMAGVPALAQASRALDGLAASPVVLAAVLLALAPAVLLASWQLFRWTDRWVSGAWPRGLAPAVGVRAAGR